MNRVFAYLNIECGKVKDDSVKRMPRISTHEHGDCILGMGDKNPKSLVSDLLDE